MLCRSSTFLHKASGVQVKTPLLIPSFSSKGFSRSSDGETSDIDKILLSTSEFITEVFLISAYDVFHGFLPQPKDMVCTPELTFVDSGGYEVSTESDYSSVVLDAPSMPKTWSLENLENVLDGWPDEFPAVFVSFDHPNIRKPFDDQVQDAVSLFRSHRQHLHLLLLKPETKAQKTLNRTIKAATSDALELGRFDIIGVTEKDLGSSMMDRMVQIAKLRLAMDDAGVSAPIHIFGGLDPLSVCLYFISGAEVFDGLTWLRYGYRDSVCVYYSNYGVIECDLFSSDDQIRMRMLFSNYYALQKLKHRMMEFVTTSDFAKLRPHDELLSEAYDSLRTKLNGRI